MIHAGRGDDVVHGSLGSDFICGRDGRDRLVGGAGRDRLFGHGRLDCLVGGRHDDRLWGGRGADVVAGRRGDDTLHGQGDWDEIYPGAGDDKVFGDHLDSVHYERAPRGITADLSQGDVATVTGWGTDLIESAYTFIGSHNNDVMIGDTGINSFAGRRGDDELRGGDLYDGLVGTVGTIRCLASSGTTSSSAVRAPISSMEATGWMSASAVRTCKTASTFPNRPTLFPKAPLVSTISHDC